eukprot:9284065-Pyramimonas_sp.AAC.1
MSALLSYPPLVICRPLSKGDTAYNIKIVECTLAVIGTGGPEGGPVKQSNLIVTIMATLRELGLTLATIMTKCHMSQAAG